LDGQEAVVKKVPSVPLLIGSVKTVTLSSGCSNEKGGNLSVLYVCQYCLKNPDSGEVSVQKDLDEGQTVTHSERLQYHAAVRISAACECFASICGYWRHHMKPVVKILGIHLPGLLF
jgi:hypothetical protein